MINAILDSQGRAPYVWAGSFSLPHHKNLRVLQHVYPEIRQQELRKKKKRNRWLEQRWADGASNSRMSAVSLQVVPHS